MSGHSYSFRLFKSFNYYGCILMNSYSVCIQTDSARKLYNLCTHVINVIYRAKSVLTAQDWERSPRWTYSSTVSQLTAHPSYPWQSLPALNLSMAVQKITYLLTWMEKTIAQYFQVGTVEVNHCYTEQYIRTWRDFSAALLFV